MARASLRSLCPVWPGVCVHKGLKVKQVRPVGRSVGRSGIVVCSRYEAHANG